MGIYPTGVAEEVASPYTKSRVRVTSEQPGAPPHSAQKTQGPDPIAYLSLPWSQLPNQETKMPQEHSLGSWLPRRGWELCGDTYGICLPTLSTATTHGKYWS